MPETGPKSFVVFEKPMPGARFMKLSFCILIICTLVSPPPGKQLSVLLVKGGGGEIGVLFPWQLSSLCFFLYQITQYYIFLNLSYFPPPHQCHFIMMHTPFYPGFLLYFLLPALPSLYDACPGGAFSSFALF